MRLTNVCRLSYGVMHRLPRVSPDVPIQYHQYIIPKGVWSLGIQNFDLADMVLGTGGNVCISNAF